MDASSNPSQRLESISVYRDELADAFYDNLFRVLPETRQYFKGEFNAQKRMFAMIFTMLVREATSGSDLRAHASHLAEVHERFDLSMEHFEIAGLALKSAIEQVLQNVVSDRERVALGWAVDKLIAALTLANLFPQRDAG